MQCLNLYSNHYTLESSFAMTVKSNSKPGISLGMSLVQFPYFLWLWGSLRLSYQLCLRNKNFSFAQRYHDSWAKMQLGNMFKGFQKLSVIGRLINNLVAFLLIILYWGRAWQVESCRKGKVAFSNVRFTWLFFFFWTCWVWYFFWTQIRTMTHLYLNDKAQIQYLRSQCED